MLEDEDSWLEPWEEQQQSRRSTSKKPLEAISLRTNRKLTNQANELENKNDLGDQWPGQDTFKVSRWERNSSENFKETTQSNDFKAKRSVSNKRPLPRSNRRRN